MTPQEELTQLLLSNHTPEFLITMGICGLLICTFRRVSAVRALMLLLGAFAVASVPSQALDVGIPGGTEKHIQSPTMTSIRELAEFRLIEFGHTTDSLPINNVPKTFPPLPPQPFSAGHFKAVFARGPQTTEEAGRLNDLKDAVLAVLFSGTRSWTSTTRNSRNIAEPSSVALALEFAQEKK